MSRSPTSQSARLIGLISDTHGLVRPEVFDALSGVDEILHAGDVGEGVIEELMTIAPVRAVLGNTDRPGTPGLEPSIEMTVGGVRIHVSHGHEVGSPTPQRLLERYDADIIVYGHTHRQLVTRAAGRLVINPGAAGHRRFDLKPSVGRLRIANETAEVELVPLD